MRIRSIKPEFWRSDDIAALPISTRLTFIGLWSYVDDNGVGSAKLSSIVADLYAEDLTQNPPETLRRVSGDLQELLNRGMIVVYEAGGKQLLYVTKWNDHQLVNKPSKGHCYPLPAAEMLNPPPGPGKPSGDTPEISGDSPGTLRPGAGEQGSRGTGERGSSSTRAGDDADVIELPARNIDRSGWRYVEQHCRTLSKASKTALANQVAILLRDNRELDDITAGLREWMTRPDAKAGLLPHLVDDAYRERTKPATKGHPTNDKAVIDWLETGARLAGKAEQHQATNQTRGITA